MNPQAQQQDEDTDYDVFAAVRPQGISIDDNLSDELDGEEVDVFAQFRPSEEEIREVKRQKANPKKHTVGESVKDAAKQGIKETLIGAGGSFGDLLKLSQKGGHKLAELLTGKEIPKEEVMKGSIRLPTSENFRDINEFIGGPGEPETTSGKAAARTGKIYGAGLAFGQINPIPAILGGVVGQATEEYGGGPLAQAAAEISIILATQGRGAGKTLVGSAKKQVQDKIDNLRKMGYTEEDIALAINSASKGKKAGIKASKGSKTEEAFENFANKSDQMVTDILEAEIPGIEKGTKNVHELASDAYGQVVKEAENIPITKTQQFFDVMDSTINQVRKTLGNSKEAKEFISTLTADTLEVISHPTAETMINFYKRLNGIGKWVGRNQKDRLINKVKDSIKESFKAEGKVGQELADKFEKVNAGIKKAYAAEDVFNLIEKTKSQGGIDYNKFMKIFDKSDNVKLFEDVLGIAQTKNLKLIANTAKDIKNFDKAWKATNLLTGNQALDVARGVGAGYYLWKGDVEGLALVLGSKGLGISAKQISEKFLTDPKFQNLLVRGLHAIKNESPKLFKSAEEAMQKYLDEEKINVNLAKP